MNETLEKLLSSFPEREQTAIRELVEKSQNFSPWKNESQIWASIILLSKGRMDAFLMVMSDAKTDWRDIVIASGLAVKGWEDVAIRKIHQQCDKC